LEDFQNNADKIETLSNGSIRYFDKFRPAKTFRLTIGSRFVVECDSLSGDVVSWNENYDSAGIVIELI
jgi:hypothetical protein